MIKHFATAFLMVLASGSPILAQTVYPIDRAEILSGARFDFKVEFPDRVDPAKLKVTVNGEDYAAVFGRTATFIEREDGKDQSALMLRDVALTKPGPVTVEVGDGTRSRKLTWTVYDTGPRKAKNVILFIGDGLSPAHRIGARLLSKGIAEGKSLGKLAIDDMPHMALVATAGSDLIITDSANSASAYATGHKSAVSAMGVYADRTASPFDDPKVETITSLVKRRLNMGIGIVTNTEVEDATPAAMVAHTRRRDAYDEIVEQFFAARPDVLMGGGSANFLPKPRPAQAQGRCRLRRKVSRRRLSHGDDRGRTQCAGGQTRYKPIARPVRHGEYGWRAGPQIPEGRRRQEISRAA